MTWLFSQVWLWVLISAVLGFAVTFFAMLGPAQPFVRRPRTGAAEADRPRGERARHREQAVDGAPQVSAEQVSAAPVADTAQPRRRRRVYEVDDVEVESWDAGHDFSGS